MVVILLSFPLLYGTVYAALRYLEVTFLSLNLMWTFLATHDPNAC